MTPQSANEIIATFDNWVIIERKDGYNTWKKHGHANQSRPSGEVPVMYSKSLDELIPICEKLGFNITIYLKHPESGVRTCWQIVIYKYHYSTLSIESENPAETLTVELAKAILIKKQNGW